VFYPFFRFSTTALHQTNVKLTWDETDPGRQRTTMRKFKKEDLLEMDFKAYLASSSDEDEPKERDDYRNGNNDSSEDEDKKIEKYKVSQICLWPFSNTILKRQRQLFDLDHN